MNNFDKYFKIANTYIEAQSDYDDVLHYFKTPASREQLLRIANKIKQFKLKVPFDVLKDDTDDEIKNKILDVAKNEDPSYGNTIRHIVRDIIYGKLDNPPYDERRDGQTYRISNSEREYNKYQKDQERIKRHFI